MIDFTLTEEQVAIQNTAREFGQKEIKPLARELDRIADPAEVFPRAKEVIRKGVRLGFPFMIIPKEFGGPGNDHRSIGIVFEELAAADAGLAGVLGISNIPWLVLLLGATEGQKREWFGRALKDETGLFLASWAATEPQGMGLDADALWEGQIKFTLKTNAVQEGDFYRIHGEKCFITSGGISKVCVLLANTPGGPSHFIVPTDTPGYQVTKIEDMMGHRAMNDVELFFDGMKVPRDNLVSGSEGKGNFEVIGALGYSDAWVGALAVGIARAAYEAALDYAKLRVLADRPIIRFQAVGMMIADMYMLIEAARALVYKSLWHNDTQPSPDPKLSALAKVFASDAAMKITTDAVQVYGGAGYMKENPVEKLMRDAKVTQIYEGTNQLLRVLASTMLCMGM